VRRMDAETKPRCQGVDGIEAGRCSVFHDHTNPTTPRSTNLIAAAGLGYI
jgi:hypothetical protein